MLSCNGITLNYAVILYDKSKSKIQIVKEIAEELPIAPVVSYFLCDSWYTSSKVMDSFIRKGFYTIGALKTNRILYPWGIRQKASLFALHLRKTDPGSHPRDRWRPSILVYGYEGGAKLAFPMQLFSSAIRRMRLEIPKHCGCFLSPDISLSTLEILETYIKRPWIIFRQSKSKLALDKYQLRSRQGIQRYWLIMSLVHFLCCMHSESYCAFEEGYAFLQKQLKQNIHEMYRFIKSGDSIEALWLAG